MHLDDWGPKSFEYKILLNGITDLLKLNIYINREHPLTMFVTYISGLLGLQNGIKT